MKARLLFLAAACAAALGASCASGPKTIPDDLSAQVLVQRAQEASDTYDYDTAVAYYNALKERYGDQPANLCTAEYEIAFIAYKQARYADARAGFEALLARYAADGGSALPQHYKILAEKVLKEIDAKTAAAKPKG